MSVRSAVGFDGGIPVGIQDLESVLSTGNNALGQDIIGVDNLVVTTINGSVYPPVAKVISTFIFPFTSTTLNTGIPQPLTGSVVLPTGIYVIFANVVMTGATPLVDFYQTKLVYGGTTLQYYQVQLDNLPANPVLQNTAVGLSGVVLSNGVFAITITAEANGDAGVLSVGANIKYYKLD